MSAIAAAWYRFRATLGRRRSGYLGLAAPVGGQTVPVISAPARAAVAPPVLALVDTSVVDAAVLGGGFGALTGPNAIFIRLRPGVSQSAGLQSPQKIASAYLKFVHSPEILAASGGAAGTLAGLGLTLNASIRRQRRDFALLKTIGFTRSQLAAVPVPVIPAAAITAAALAALILANLIAAVPGRRAGRTPTATVLRAE